MHRNGQNTGDELENEMQSGMTYGDAGYLSLVGILRKSWYSLELAMRDHGALPDCSQDSPPPLSFLGTGLRVAS